MTWHDMTETFTEMCLCLKAGGIPQSCDITVELLSCSQQRLPDSVEVCVKGVLQDWNSSSLAQTSTESWVLQCSSSRAEDFCSLMMELSAHALHMVRLLLCCHHVQSDSYTLEISTHTSQFSLFNIYFDCNCLRSKINVAGNNLSLF